MQPIVLVDDHILLRSGLANLIESFGDYKILFEADNGKDFIEKLQPSSLPDIVLLDINMPLMNGFETCEWLKKHYPVIKILALSMNDDEASILKMFKIGARGYVLKDCEPADLKVALHSIKTKGYYYSEMITGTIINAMNASGEDEYQLKLKHSFSEREMEFIKLACTEMTYKQIAEIMFLSPRTIDGYRIDLFEKLKIKTRTGLAMYAIKNGIVQL